jgi:hypothetical protein
MICDPNIPNVECLSCGSHFCFLCSTEWHQGTCKDAEKKREKSLSKKERNRKKKEEKENKKALEQLNSIPCSKCGIHVTKIDGCNHISW